MRAKLVAAHAAPFVAGLAFDRWVKPVLEWIATLPVCESLPWVRAEVIFGIGLVWLAALVALRTGWKVWTLNQSPLPGAWVWSRTRVITGKHARFAAIGYFFTAVLLLLGPIALFLGYDLYILFCFPQACGC